MIEEDIEFIIDITHLKPGYDMNYFMENSVKEADKVLIFCDETYSQKANERKGGAGIETYIISPEVYSSAKQEKFIPIFFDENSIPSYLKGRFGIMLKNGAITGETIKNESIFVEEDWNLEKEAKFPKTKNGILNEVFKSFPEEWTQDYDLEKFVYNKDIFLTIEEAVEKKRGFFEEWANRHPDKRADYLEYQIKYNGTVIEKIALVAVDGYRAMLPLPKLGTNIIERKYLNFANVVYSMGSNEEYVYRSGLEILENI